MRMLQKCGQMFAFRHIDGIKRSPGFAAARGKVCHKTAEADLTSKRDKGVLLPDETIADMAATEARRAVEHDGIHLGPEDPATLREATDKLIDQTVAFSGLHHKIAAPRIEPVAIEQPWVLAVAGFPYDLAGTFDVTEKDGFRDAKNRGKGPKEDEAHQSNQLTAYALAYYVTEKRLPEKIALDIVVRTAKQGKVIVQETSRSMADLKRSLAEFEVAAQVIESGAFMHADPEVSWWCSVQWCGYFSICPWVRRPVSVAPGGGNLDV
jgi:hypothetical protein